MITEWRCSEALSLTKPLRKGLMTDCMQLVWATPLTNSSRKCLTDNRLELVWNTFPHTSFAKKLDYNLEPIWSILPYKSFMKSWEEAWLKTGSGLGHIPLQLLYETAWLQTGAALELISGNNRVRNVKRLGKPRGLAATLMLCWCVWIASCDIGGVNILPRGFQRPIWSQVVWSHIIIMIDQLGCQYKVWDEDSFLMDGRGQLWSSVSQVFHMQVRVPTCKAVPCRRSTTVRHWVD